MRTTTRNPSHPAAWLTALALLALSGCGGDSPKTETGAPKKKPAATETAAASAAPTQINVFVDASTGMRGFMRPNKPGEAGSEFQRTVAELLTSLNRQRATVPASFYFVREKTAQSPRVLQPTTYGDILNTVSTGIKDPALGTEMPEMLREVLKLQKQRPGTLSIVVSDFIYAPADLTKTWLVKNDVQDALSEVPPAELAVAVYAGTSAFRDKFFPGNRTKFQLLSGSKIPYYVWVLGRPDQVAAARQTLLRPLTEAGLRQATFNAPFSPEYAALAHFQNVGNWFIEKGAKPLTLTFAESPTVKKPAEFVLGLKLQEVAADVVRRLPETLKLDAGGTDAQLLSVKGVSEEPAAASKAYLQAYSHLAKIKLGRLPAAGATLRLHVTEPLPGWVAQLSTTNDSNIAAQGPKTFLLSETLGGVAAYFAQQPGATEALSLPVRVRRAE